MATPLGADALVRALRAEGVRVVEYRSWRTHNRNARGAWGPVNGVAIHHTAGSNSLALVYGGRPDLPGPLAHAHLSKAGTVSLTSAGRANHAGTVAANAHAAVIAESSTHPRPDQAEPVDGNRCYYGLEIENLGTGKDPYPDVQYDQAVRWAAALCRAHGWSANSVVGHKELTRRKIDPSFDMDNFRRAVAARLRHPASWGPSATTNPPEQEDDMPSATEIANAVWSTTIPDPLRPGSGEEVTIRGSLAGLAARAGRLESQLAAQTATIRELAAALGSRDAEVDVDSLVARIETALERVTVRLEVEN